MTREQKIQHLLSKGFYYNQYTGFIYGSKGNPIICKTTKGYIKLSIYNNKKRYTILGHQFAFYYIHKRIVECIDHINRIKSDNRIINLRSVNKSINALNQKRETGASYDKRNKKWSSSIMINYKKIFIGYFNDKNSALEAYNNKKLEILNN